MQLWRVLAAQLWQEWVDTIASEGQAVNHVVHRVSSPELICTGFDFGCSGNGRSWPTTQMSSAKLMSSAGCVLLRTSPKVGIRLLT